MNKYDLIERKAQLEVEVTVAEAKARNTLHALANELDNVFTADLHRQVTLAIDQLDEIRRVVQKSQQDDDKEVGRNFTTTSESPLEDSVGH